MSTGIVVSYKKDGPISFLTFTWEVDQAAILKDFAEVYRLIGDIKDSALLFDLSAIGYINSGFIWQVSELYSNVDEAWGRMVIVGNPVINDTFDLVGFKEFVKITDSQQEGINELKDFLWIKTFDFRFTD